MNEPAFPVASWCDVDKHLFQGVHVQSGMTLRDYFAAKALQGMLGCPDDGRSCPIEDYTRSAYLYADAMLKSRTEPKL